MQIVPVVDLKQGQVVRAVRGQRSDYRPIVSGLCAGSDPVTVARALVKYASADTLYVADLDALTGGAVQVAVIRDLLAALPGVHLWLDAGFADAAAFGRLRARLSDALGESSARVAPVFASEALASAEAARASLADKAGAILSLDRRGGELMDPAGCWADERMWPDRVIVMTLDRVGSFDGPDLATLRDCARRAPQAMLIGAGGIRDEADLRLAEQAGAAAWLTASALHDRRLAPRTDCGQPESG
ncbi:MAG: nickel transporter [Proteobacteria bacterium]|nr:nickel transporter [Pseudomonadota bacterium]